mgnify:CR=1 FL=1
MAAEELVAFLVRGLVDNPDDVSVSTVEEGDSSLVIEVSVTSDDAELVRGDDGETLRHIKAIVNASSGKRKAIVELVETAGNGDSEE